MSLSPKALAALPVAIALLAGCSSSDDTPIEQTSMLNPDSGTDPIVLNTYDGTFLEACTADDPSDPASGSEVLTYTVSGDTAEVRTFNFSDAACVTPGTPAEIVFDLSIVYPGETVETTQGTADAVNLTVEAVTIDGQMPTPEQQLELADDNVYATDYDIVLLDGSSLYFGDTDDVLDGTSAENRPATLDTSRAAIRQ